MEMLASISWGREGVGKIWRRMGEGGVCGLFGGWGRGGKSSVVRCINTSVGHPVMT